jgi:rhodanese-related sulfurtransferase
MAVKRIESDEAAALLGQGWTYLDVRSVGEFEQGHPEGAYNIPLMHFTPGRGMTPNPDFLEEALGAFGTDTQLVVGCKSGGRSAQAAGVLGDAGVNELADVRGGFNGEVDRTGAVTCAGWQSRGLPVSTAAGSGRSYDELKKA